MKKSIKQMAVAGLVGLGGLMLAATSASAYVVCNAEGDCWHVRDHYTYQPTFGVVVHPDTWKWEDRDAARYRWREHEGRGYWHNGVWITF